MKTLAIIQARMASTRLPGKVLADLAGRPLLARVVERAAAAREVDQVLVATSREPADDPVAAFCAREGIACVRGSQDDVLDRFWQAARTSDAEILVRLTGDCPLLDPAVVDRVVADFKAGGCDYASNTLDYTWPEGLDVEVFSRQALACAWQEAKAPAEREHVTPFIRNSGRFVTRSVEGPTDYSARNYHWSVDRPEELGFARQVYARLGEGGRIFGCREVVELMAREPELARAASGAVINEGYYLTIAREPETMPVVARNPLVRSRELLEKAKLLIPSQSQTFSKGPNQFVGGVSPVFLERGEGARVWDVDGNSYIDLATALGPVILGYAHPEVTEAVVAQARRGASFSLPHPLEVALAERICRLVPCAEMVRYGKNGSDVTTAAVRLARACTGRELIACSGYHGWHDWYIGTTTRDLGVPKAVAKLTLTFNYNDLAGLETLFAEHPGQIAGVIMEPVGVVDPKPGFLAGVRELTQKHGALLIFDEVVTGFRVALGGAQEHYGVTPDLALFGKALANGMPLSVITGRRQFMRVVDDIFFSFTFGGEALSLAAALATLEVMERERVIAHLWEVGRQLQDGYNILARELGLAEDTRSVGLPPHTVMIMQPTDGAEGLLWRSLLQQELVKRGVLFLVGVNACHSLGQPEVDHVLRACKAALLVMAEAKRSGDPARFLEGPMVQAVFRKP